MKILKKGSSLESLVYSAAYTLLKPFENPTGLARPLWKDYSKYQWPLNLGPAVQNGMVGAVHRAGISWGYPDPNGLDWMTQVALYSIYNSTYHVIYCDQPVVKQADDVWYKIQPHRTNFPRVIDLEVNRGIANEQYADATWEMSELVLARDGVRPLIYSRAGLIDQWLAPFWTAEMMNAHYYWLAQYLFDTTREHAGPPTLPNKVLENRVLLHQTASKKPGFPGESGGTSYTDYDRWELGNDAEMRLIISSIMGDVVEPPPDDDLAALTLRVNSLEAEISQVEGYQTAQGMQINEMSAEINTLKDRVTVLEGGDTGEHTYLFTVTRDPRTNAQFISGENDATPPRPIFTTYPNDSAPTSERIQYAYLEKVPVDPTIIVGDAGVRCVKILNRTANGHDLYLTLAHGFVS